MRKVSLTLVFLAYSVVFGFSTHGDLEIADFSRLSANGNWYFTGEGNVNRDTPGAAAGSMPAPAVSVPANFNFHAVNAHRGAVHNLNISFPWLLLLLLPSAICVGILLGNIFLSVKHKLSSSGYAPFYAPSLATARCASYAPTQRAPQTPVSFTPQAAAPSAPVSLEEKVLDVVFGIPEGMYFDTHTVIKKLCVEHGAAYLAEINNHAKAAQHRTEINSILAYETDIVQKVGNSYSKDIHQKYNECHLFLRIAR